MRNRNTLVVTTRELESTWLDARVVRTMLDMISCLECASFATVVLGGDYARDHDIVAFLREAYPSVAVVRSSGWRIPSVMTAALV